MHAFLFVVDGITCLHKNIVSIPDTLSGFTKKKINNVEYEKLSKIWKTLMLTSVILHSSPYKTLIRLCLPSQSQEGNYY